MKKFKYYDLWVEYQKEINDKKKKKLEKRLVELYYPLVKKISFSLAEKIRWRVSPDELSSFGVDGLYIAIRRFSLDRNTTFPTYASIRIRGSMLDEIRRQDIIPRSVRINYNNIEKTRVLLESKKNRRVLDDEILKELDINNKEYNINYKKFHPISFGSLDTSDMFNSNNYDNSRNASKYYLEDNSIKSSDNYIIRKEFFNKLMGKGFSPLERKILYYYYYANLTMEEIAKKFNLSESRVSQIHKMLLPRLKDKILRNPKYFSNDIQGIIKSCNNKDEIF